MNKISKARLLQTLSLVVAGMISTVICRATTTIDVLLVYDTTAETWVDSNGGMAVFSANAIAKMNLAMQNSGIDCSFRLVHAADLNYTYSGDLGTDLSNLRSGAGDLATALSLRDTHGADVVAMLVDTGSAFGWIGQAYVLSSISGQPNNAFSVSAIQSVEIGHILTHEVGHNLGCGHSTNQVTEPGPGPLFEYAAGWYFTGSDTVDYHTIMAYNNDGHGNTYSPAPLFSTPLIDHQGTAAGDAVDGDNSECIRETMSIVAGYRPDSFTLGNDTPVSLSEIPKAFSFSVNGSDWCALGIAPTSDHNIQVDDNYPFSSPYESSEHGGTTRDFVVINGHSYGSDTHYVQIYDGSPSTYSIEGEWSIPDLSVGGSSPETMNSDEVLDAFEVSLTAGEQYECLADVTSGSSDLSIFIYEPSRSSGNRSSADWWVNSNGAGGDEQISFTADTTGAYGIVLINENAASATYTISVSHPPRGSLQFASPTYSVNENDGSVRIYVNRTGGSYQAASVDYSTANGTATSGSDYTTTFGTLSWTNGESTSKHFDVPIIDDTNNEEDETFTAGLISASGSDLGSPASATITIVDYEVVPTKIISVSGDLNFGNVQVGSSSNRLLTVSNSGNSPLAVSSIDCPTGFSASPGNFTVTPGDSAPVTITFSPTAVQNFGGTITVDSDMTDGTNTVACSGIGVIGTLFVSGHVRTSENLGIAAVEVSADNGGSSNTTDTNGYYELTVPYGWSGNVTPTRTDYSFDPASWNFSSITVDQLNQDFSGNQINTLHSADYQEPAWVIDGSEFNRILAYWRAGAYHIGSGADGYEPGAGDTNGVPHKADYSEPFWVIDGTEANRVLAYWRAGGYHLGAGADGYQPGAP